jgi:hypothetical protein
MSYGLENWGTDGWGGADFIATNHVPLDNTTNISRTPTISFSLISQNGPITIFGTSGIQLTANSIPLIVDGYFTANATGSINFTDPINVSVIAHVLHSFSPLTTVSVVVDTIDTANQHPSEATWQFIVSSGIHTFTNYVVRGFQRILRVAT